MNEIQWRKSSRSGSNGQCVEVARVEDTVKVRDSRDPDGPILSFTMPEWYAFLDGTTRDEFKR